MAHVKEILERTPPDILYHYTKQQGLLGILGNKEIWASHTQYLNDVSEFRHALDLTKDELSVMEKEAATDRLASACLRMMQEALFSGIEAISVFVCSFSEKGDVLSQWRAYGGDASGFAVGFSGPLLREMSKEYGRLVPVVYEENKQRSLVRALLTDVLDENLQKYNEHVAVTPAGNLVPYLYRYAPILKHKSFEEEREWRIITKPLMLSNKRVAFRPGGSMLIPYFRLPLDSQEWLGIREIVIGPTPYPVQSSDSVKGLLTKHEIATSSFAIPQKPFVEVRSSEVPYRNW